MIRTLCLLILAAALVGCRAYTDSTPTRILEGDNAANYERVFREPVPQGVTVVHSVVAAYAFRPGVVTTDDFEFEMLASDTWVSRQVKRLSGRNDEFWRRELDERRKDARPWYAPKSLDEYDLYRDLTSVGYLHMLVEKQRQADGRRRVFISKH
ncbi:MAG: hypothetical protein ACO1TE_22815 [Prosthecobacter sp.]